MQDLSKKCRKSVNNNQHVEAYGEKTWHEDSFEEAVGLWET